MSLLDFFPTQRRRWQQQPAGPSPDFLAGGLAALALAETNFRTLPLVNAQQQAHDTQQELEDVSYKLTRAHKKINHLEASLLAAETKEVSIPKLHQRRAQDARKKLRQVLQLATHLTMLPEKKLHEIQGLVTVYLDAVGRNDKGLEALETPNPAVPLPE